MKKVNIISEIAGYGVVAVVRADSKEEAVKISEACVIGGLKLPLRCRGQTK
jgi:2-dehydro-3-deoxyphosphogluconate aldolase / (4S)-4-hydroxy-2-oxoglutarate aldolase